jgi:hypothetical protein
MRTLIAALACGTLCSSLHAAQPASPPAHVRPDSMPASRPASCPVSRPASRPATLAASVPADVAERLVRQLGADSFRQREAATEAILKLGKEITPILRRHENDPDLEIRQRIQDLLAQLDPPPLRTEQFESGELAIEDVDAEALAKFLEDMNQRLAYARSLPDAASSQSIPYLSDWVERVKRELQRRAA